VCFCHLWLCWRLLINFELIAGVPGDKTVTMWLRIVRTTCFAALTVVAVPYAVAMVTNILCGWPLCTHRYRRAFNPYKVFALNWALLFQLNKLRYCALMIRWRRFYQNASRNRLIKVSTNRLCIVCVHELYYYLIMLWEVVKFSYVFVNYWSFSTYVCANEFWISYHSGTKFITVSSQLHMLYILVVLHLFCFHSLILRRCLYLDSTLLELAIFKERMREFLFCFFH